MHNIPVITTLAAARAAVKDMKANVVTTEKGGNS